MTPSKLRELVNATGSKFFTPNNMKFGGDTMGNYGVCGPVVIETFTGDKVKCWKLYRKKATSKGLDAPAYFACDTYEKRCGKEVSVEQKQPNG
jgi:hypothetical protein